MSLITTIAGGIGSGDPLGGVLTEVGGGAVRTAADSGLNLIGTWILDGTKAALREVAAMISASTTPQLTSAWFSATYWRVAGLATLLTVPFVFAAAVQALMRSEPTLLVKVVFAYVPLSLLAVSLLAPVTMLLLRATDAMCAVVSAGAIGNGARFLDSAAKVAAELSVADGSPFLAVLVGVMTVAAAIMLELELLVRAAAVYVVVMMLPLAFAAFVWPARRIWAIRLLELLVSLILAKFVIVAVLSLAGSAYSLSGGGTSKLLTAMALLLLSTFAPWALLKVLPFTELGAGAAGMLRHELPNARNRALSAGGTGIELATGAADIAATLPARLHRQAEQATGGDQTGGGTRATRATGVGATDAAADANTDQQASTPAGRTVPADRSETALYDEPSHTNTVRGSAPRAAGPTVDAAMPGGSAVRADRRAQTTESSVSQTTTSSAAEAVSEAAPGVADPRSETTASLDPADRLPEPEPTDVGGEAGPGWPAQRVNPFDRMGIGKHIRLDSPSLRDDDE